MFIPSEKCLFFSCWHGRTNGVTDFPVSDVLWCEFVSERCGVLECTLHKVYVCLICIESLLLAAHVLTSRFRHFVTID